MACLVNILQILLGERLFTGSDRGVFVIMLIIATIEGFLPFVYVISDLPKNPLFCVPLVSSVCVVM